MDEIRFYGRYLPYYQFSNFYSAPIMVDGLTYPTTEHYYQSQKTLDPDQQEKIRLASTPALCKKLGSEAPLRSDWEKVKEEVMYKALYYKFTQHEELKQLLLSTGQRPIAEYTKNDKYWAKYEGSGMNRLGILLMYLRENLLQSEST